LSVVIVESSCPRIPVATSPRGRVIPTASSSSEEKRAFLAGTARRVHRLDA
jgi:hypothetical protein